MKPIADLNFSVFKVSRFICTSTLIIVKFMVKKIQIFLFVFLDLFSHLFLVFRSTVGRIRIGFVVNSIRNTMVYFKI